MLEHVLTVFINVHGFKVDTFSVLKRLVGIILCII